MLHDEGGSGRPVVLLHGLMGSAATWSAHVGWFRRYGHVYTFDAAGHGRPAPARPITEEFVADLAAALAPLTEPAVVIGHSMGALHGWMFAAAYPSRVSGLVVEDMAPDFGGRTADDWAATIAGWPRFATAADVLDFFGPIAGPYFLAALRPTADGYRLHGPLATFVAIAAEWGTRDFWPQWAAVRCPALLIEAEHTVTPTGQMQRMAARPATDYVRVVGAGHLVHDERPAEYRAAVGAFLDRLGRRSSSRSRIPGADQQ
ncbi:alpha/beta fold hydrolase [Skermania piniformis]|uniref:Alpha/beta hydrolase n=1 Tax=Skermania pinensis TaxID=39122 RepID=A0ABX8S716_9ACTN|nr:alpha/beta hydrolase [Skermania piniformis]QXQ13629.1 alpha/beta hydrolase [Skermania piniformis]